MPNPVFTVGHSTHTQVHLVQLLLPHHISVVVDVRSQPFSKMHPQFNRDELKSFLAEKGFRYLFMGAELGARSSDPRCYSKGKVVYDRIAETASFRAGLRRVQDGSISHRIALMCAEKEPLECHRTILVARHLAASGANVQHILSDGTVETHTQTMLRLRRELGFPDYDIFRSDEELLADAYAQQEARIAYETENIPPDPILH